MNSYSSVRADDVLWSRLSHELRGKDFLVPYRWRKGSRLDFKDWKLLVKQGFVGKKVYVQKTKYIDYRTILGANIKQ